LASHVRVSHGYDRVDLEIVWRTIRGDLPDLYRQVQTVANGLAQDDNDSGKR